MPSPKMFYFGPLKESGHFLFGDNGWALDHDEREKSPWQAHEIDGILQPGCFIDRWGGWRHEGPQTEGEALVHHKNGWTALSFWDRTVDDRHGCNSTFMAEGTFTFEEMVELAKTRFAERWGKMKFPVVQYKDKTDGQT